MVPWKKHAGCDGACNPDDNPKSSTSVLNSTWRRRTVWSSRRVGQGLAGYVLVEARHNNGLGIKRMAGLERIRSFLNPMLCCGGTERELVTKSVTAVSPSHGGQETGFFVQGDLPGNGKAPASNTHYSACGTSKTRFLIYPLNEYIGGTVCPMVLSVYTRKARTLS